MLGFHKRTRSLIPVKELAKYDVVPLEEEMYDYESDSEEEMDEAAHAPDTTTPSRRKQLMLVYLVFFAEA
jgi:hypothetical protein